MQGPMLAAGSVTAGPNPTLWSSSRPWRALVLSSCMLTSLAISAPLLLPQAPPGSSAQDGCTLQIDRAPTHVFGKVTGFVPEAMVASATRIVEAQLGAKISPGYVSLKRIRATAYPASGNWSTMAAITDNVVPKIGDLVDLNSRYRDPNLPCSFIPWTVNRIVSGAGTD